MGLDSLIPGTESSTDVVSWKIFINGAELNNEILVSQIIINKTFNKIAFAKLIFLDGSVADRDFVLSNDDQFKPGNEIEIQLGYYGETETVFEGIIIKHGIRIREEQDSILVIEAKDKAIKLTGARKSAYFINKTDKDIITSLAGESIPDIEITSIKHKQLIQFESTNWDFILTRAEANSMLVLTDDGHLIIKKPATTEAVVTATYGDNIFEFEAEMDARRHYKSIKGQSWDFTKQATENSSDGTSSFTEPGNLSSDDLGEVLGSEIKLSHIGHLTQDQLQSWADAYALRNQISKAIGRVNIQGDALVKPGTTITLDGVGERFNGDVFVTGVLHHYDGEWKTDVQFGWQEDWFYKKPDVMECPASGLLPGVNGLQVGIVLSTDDTEDGGQYRVKVHVPTFTSGNEGMWARVATLDAGPERGVYFRPQVNDEVILGFLNDDPREPVILGYLHSKDKNKSPLPENTNGAEYGIVTKEKGKLIFDDTNKRITLSVKTSKGEMSVVLNNSSSALELKDDNNNSITMDPAGISINSGKTIVISGKQVKIN